MIRKPMTRSVRWTLGRALAFWCALFLVLAPTSGARASGVYFVKSGDTLAGISQVFGVSVERIVELNRLDAPSVVQGDKIRIPDPLTQSSRQSEAALQPPAARGEGQQTQPAPEAASRLSVDSDRILHQAVCRDERVYHPVSKGETLSSISRKYSARLEDLLRLNRLTRRSRLSIGQLVLVRRSGPRTHTVLTGDTLAGIASSYGVATADLVRLNQLDGQAIAVDQQLLLETCDPLASAGTVPPPLERAAAHAQAPRTAAVPSEGQLVNEANDGPASVTVTARRLVSFARMMLDIPYRFGGTTLRGIDCSAYVQRVFGLVNVQLPRTAREQFSVGARINRHELAVGDLVFFRTYASFPSHVGIYVGDNQFIHASSMVNKVTIDSMDRRYYSKRFIGARRLVVDELAGR